MLIYVSPEEVVMPFHNNFSSAANENSKQVVRDVRDRGRDIEGCIKQWFNFVKPNFQRYVEPQRYRAGQQSKRGIRLGLELSLCRYHRAKRHREQGCYRHGRRTHSTNPHG